MPQTMTCDSTGPLGVRITSSGAYTARRAMKNAAGTPKPYQCEALIQLVNSVLAVGSKKAA